MKIRVTTLAENTAGKIGTLAEHGLSMLAEVDGLTLLVDTGQTTTAVHNARTLGVELSRVGHIVLSHGHGDHTGGLDSVLAETGQVVRLTRVVRPKSVALCQPFASQSGSSTVGIILSLEFSTTSSGGSCSESAGRSLPQCLHTIASRLINSAQYGHFLLSPVRICCSSFLATFPDTTNAMMNPMGPSITPMRNHPKPLRPLLLATIAERTPQASHTKKTSITLPRCIRGDPAWSL